MHLAYAGEALVSFINICTYCLVHCGLYVVCETELQLQRDTNMQASWPVLTFESGQCMALF